MTAPGADSLERIVPHTLAADEATGQETLRLHLERYRFAAGHLRSGRILDIACGVGYGSVVLADAGPGNRVVGADLAIAALQTAHHYYPHQRVSLARTDGGASFRPAAFDSIVCLETLEHVPDPRAFLAGLVGLLVTGGMLIGSVPVTPSVDANPHHLTDFTERSFLRMGAVAGLEVVATLDQEQRYPPLAMIFRTERRARDLRRNLLAFYLNNPGSLGRRLGSLWRDGFRNRYLTVAWRLSPRQAATSESDRSR